MRGLKEGKQEESLAQAPVYRGSRLGLSPVQSTALPASVLCCHRFPGTLPADQPQNSISNVFWSSDGVVVLKTLFPLHFNFISVLVAKELRLINMSLYFTLLSLIYNSQLYSSCKSCPLCIFAAENKDPFSLFLVQKFLCRHLIIYVSLLSFLLQGAYSTRLFLIYRLSKMNFSTV